MRVVNPYEEPKDKIHALVQQAQLKMIAEGHEIKNPHLFLTKEQRQAQARERAKAKMTKKRGKKKRAKKQ